MVDVKLIDEFGHSEVIDAMELKIQGRNKWPGWICSSGINSLYIDWDGKIFNGSCRVLELGNIYDENLRFADSWTICTKSACNCLTEVKLPKSKDFTDWSKNSLIPIDDYPIYIQWDITRRCNFDCSYCPPFIHSKEGKLHPIHILKDTVARIDDHFVNKLLFCFAGGEPTVYPELIELCQFIKRLNHKVHIQTNGAQLPKYWRELAGVVDAISISVHLEHMTEKRLSKTLDSFRDLDFDVEVKLMDYKKYPEKFDIMNEIVSNHPVVSKKYIVPIRKIGCVQCNLGI